MRTALIVGGAALLVYWCWKSNQPENPINVNVDTSMTGAGQDATVYGPGGLADGVLPGRPYDSAAAKAAAKAFGQKPVTSKLSLFRALSAVSAPTPQSPAPVPPPYLVHGTTAVTQVT
jgi:hypothetical protein